jgi:hypothetical protein
MRGHAPWTSTIHVDARPIRHTWWISDMSKRVHTPLTPLSRIEALRKALKAADSGLL